MQSTRSFTSPGDPGEHQGSIGHASGAADGGDLALHAIDDALNEAWFDRSPASGAAGVRTSSLPPAQLVGEFLGDELADAWLR